MGDVRGAANRVLIALVGIASVGAGGWLGVTWLVAKGQVRWELPSWWPGLGAHGHLLDRAAVDRVRVQDWWSPVVISGLAVGCLLCLCWLFAQGGRRGPTALSLRRSGARLRRRTLESAIAAETETLPGVAGARARLTMKGGRGHRGAYRQGRFLTRMTVVLEPYAEPGPVLDKLVHGPLADAGSSTGLGRPKAAVRMRAASHRSRRAR
ncbi:alkaline shock response membrane anchor protein AmaP [Streptomyces tremellae]|uniref:alkaline shock response membrane anchor protein AmaP n=1 Tax=Streptomyces tremellae TaxID=1124239 RepID=UPI0031EF9820